MSSAVSVLGRARGLEMFANWTDRITAGEVPPAPPRPKGLERNLVLTMWDWGGPATFAHDELATDKRNPTANAYGPIYGVDWGNDGFLTLDTLEHTAKETRIPVLDPKTPPGKPQSMPVPSPYWGTKLYRFDPAISNHAAMDSKGRVWMSARFRVPENQPSFCKDHPSAALAPMPTSFRQIQYHDPKTQQFKQVDICFDVHHVQFASDADETIYGNGPFSGAIGWVNTRKLEATGDAGAAQGWCRPWFDVNGDGKIDRAVDREIKVGLFYSVIPHPRRQRLGRGAGTDAGKDRPHRAEDVRERSLRAAVRSGHRRRRLHAARHRRRFERRDLDGACRQRPPRELRPAQVQGPFGSGGDGRPALPRGLDAVSRAGAAFQGRAR